MASVATGIMGTRHTPAPAPGAAAAIRAELRAAVTGSRVVDLRPVIGALRDAAVSAYTAAVAGGHDPILTDPEATSYILAEAVTLPLPSPPRVGMGGVYLLADHAAAILTPAGADTHTAQWVVLTGHGLWTPLDVGHITADGTGYRLGYTQTTASRTAAEAVAGTDPDTWEAAYGDHELGGGLTAGDMLRGFLIDLGAVLLANSIAQADPGILRTSTTPPRLARAAARRNRPKPKGSVWLDLPGLRYEPARGTFTAHTGAGVAWHMVRGHWRHLRSDRFTRAAGTRVWVSAHSRGRRDAGTSTTPYRVRGVAS